MSHTAGPWDIGIDRNGAAVSVLDKYAGTVCDILTGNEEDARLIAAAPELLQVCRTALEWMHKSIQFGIVMGVNVRGQRAFADQIEAAIAKATESK